VGGGSVGGEAAFAGGRIHLSDAVRDDARATIDALRDRGLEIILISGDNRRAAAAMAAAAGIDAVAAEVTPEGKADWVRRRREAGNHVLVAGDGLNDGPALAAADVGVAMAGGAASSVLVADGVISSNALAPLLGGFRAARACRTIVDGNLRRSLIYNVAAVAAAAAGLINPLIAAVLMPLSSGIVIYGAYRVEKMVQAEEQGGVSGGGISGGGISGGGVSGGGISGGGVSGGGISGAAGSLMPEGAY
jgi:P-type Cu+ transporter